MERNILRDIEEIVQARVFHVVRHSAYVYRM